MEGKKTYERKLLMHIYEFFRDLKMAHTNKG